MEGSYTIHATGRASFFRPLSGSVAILSVFLALQIICWQEDLDQLSTLFFNCRESLHILYNQDIWGACFCHHYDNATVLIYPAVCFCFWQSIDNGAVVSVKHVSTAFICGYRMLEADCGRWGEYRTSNRLH
jgi:hypothetical protein